MESNNIVDKRNWRTGYFIRSSKTTHWPERQIELTNEYENRTVFSNFKEEDKGKSRKRICICDNTEDAAFICKAVNEYDKLKEDNKCLLEALKELVSAGQEALDYKDANVLQEAISKYSELLK